jgi:hypothetical protein
MNATRSRGMGTGPRCRLAAIRQVWPSRTKRPGVAAWARGDGPCVSSRLIRDPAGDGRRCPWNAPASRRGHGTTALLTPGHDPAGDGPIGQRPGVATRARGDGGTIAAVSSLLGRDPAGDGPSPPTSPSFDRVATAGEVRVVGADWQGVATRATWAT